MITSKEIRKSFLDFFKKHGHTVVPSSSLVPVDDPTLLFTNAGMVQFKKVFLGQEKRPYKRATSAQKCLRVGGKHNDLENVGRTRRHHTFFEMLGNFSFGDYFKEQAIWFAWTFLTKELGLPKERLYVTVYKDDDEAANLWKKIADIPDSRIYRLGEKDNFWAMGETGPCGPCSEILVDQGQDMACGPNCEIGVCDCDRYLEVWNLVFMQYNRDEDGNLTPLPKPSIDTGMGLERISAICQGVHSNFDTDLFKGLIEFTCSLANVSYGENEDIDTALRVISDHTRAISFMVADGILPSNEGRGYILRRLIRRAFRFGRFLKLNDPFLAKVAEKLTHEMGDVYPEIKEHLDFTKKVVTSEEENFSKTLDRGLGLLQEELNKLKAKGISKVPGSVVFKLYDTYGFPIDIVRDIGEKQGFFVDEEGFENYMKEQRERSKASWAGVSQKDFGSLFDAVIAKGISCNFTGYEKLKDMGQVISILSLEGEEKNSLNQKEEGFVIFDKTPFYGESGGQVGDRGKILGDGFEAEVVDTLKPTQDIIVHKVLVKKGKISVSDSAELIVNSELRKATARNHTCTHLLHAALRSVLGEHVKQSGSYVAPDRLRFDFSHIKALTREEISKIEELVNKWIMDNREVVVNIMPYDEAKKIGAIGLFEEKYGANVRVVEVEGVSKELCGGTHLNATGEAGSFYIVHETSVAAGIRRIEAVVGTNALLYVKNLRDILGFLSESLKAPYDKLKDKVIGLQEEIKKLTKQKEELAKKTLFAGSGDILDEVEQVNGINVLIKELDISDVKTMRNIMDGIRDRLKSGIALLCSKDGKKVTLLLYVSRDLHDRFTAKNLIKEIAKEVKGGGGGREDLAQAGGSFPEGFENAKAKLKKLIG
ncbi:alanine--tRNA ligase [Desulfothermus naphthae]